MATTSATMGDSKEEDSREVECPIKGCGYRGEPRSVEAHISGSQRDGHKGEMGRFYRGALEGEDLPPPGKVDPRESEELEAEEGDEVDDTGVGTEVAEGTEELEEPEAPAFELSEEGGEVTQEMGGGGLPLPALSSKQLLIFLLVAAVLLTFLAWRKQNQDEEEDEDDLEDEQRDLSEDELSLIE